jgi:hypothetical protein
MTAEYGALTWPPGVSLATFSPTAEYRFQVGVGRNHVDTQWVCAWSKDWLDTRTTDPTRAAADLKTLDGVQSLTLWKNMDAPGRSHMLDIFAKAQLGDADPMIAFRSELSC